MKKIFILLFVFFSINSFAQNKEIEELQKYLRSYHNEKEHYGKKNKEAYRLLSLDKYNHVAIRYLYSTFYKEGQKDSIFHFFDNLIENNKNETEPYLIKEEYARRMSLTHEERIANLNKALEINSTDENINYLLGKLYYELFILENKKDEPTFKANDYAEKTIHYLSFLCNQDNGYKGTLKFPLIQLANFLKDSSKKELFESYNYQSIYFPVFAFCDFPDNWENDFTNNLLKNVESAIFHINWYSEYLSSLEEPVLSDSLPAEVYRFTYLPSFHNPIVVGLVKNNDEIYIYWKMSDGKGGYEPGEVIVNKSKSLTNDDWNKFTALINSSKFWDMPSVNHFYGLDGSQWILEGKKLGKYHVVDRWGGGEIAFICKTLLEMTDLELNKKIY